MATWGVGVMVGVAVGSGVGVGVGSGSMEKVRFIVSSRSAPLRNPGLNVAV